MALQAGGGLSGVQLQALREQLHGQLLWRSIELHQLLTALQNQSCPAAERDTLHARIAVAEAHTSRLHQALERMRTGDYGSCRTCEAPIPFSWLKLWPLARQCPACGPQAAADPPPGDGATA